MIRRILKGRLDRFWGQEEQKKCLVRTYYPDGITGNKQKLGRAEGVTLFQPERSLKKYPYVEFELLECVEWGRRWCLATMSFQTEGTPIYWCIRKEGRRVWQSESSGFVALVSQGVETEYQFWNIPGEDIGVIENAEKIIDTNEVMEAEMKAELLAYAIEKGWSIARRCPEENLIAIWCVKNGVLNVLETPPSVNALGIDERIALEEEE